MKRLIAAVVLVLSVISFGAVRVGITQIVDHPALNAVFDGIVKALEDSGFKVGQDVIIDRQNAQGSMQNAVTIAKKFATEKVDFVVAIATPSAQACVQAISDRPVIFSAVTDPVGAGLIKQLGKNDSNVVGVSDMVPVATQLRLIKKIFPNAKKVGVIYNPGEANSVTLTNIAKSAAPSLEMTVVDIPGTSPSEMITALNSIGPNVDVLYIGTDNTAASSIEAIGSAALRLKKPIVAADIDIARGGGVVGFGFNYFQVGVETGQLLVALLKGAKASDLESHVVGPDSLVLYINLDIAKQLNVEIPSDLLERANIVVKDGKEVSK
ncbi:ABC transporter substrate-binding protein [Thermotoga profunda]|uniref:ABC transporter substrate-binding protein n=1 Tax=Thermotoga profunda TaxID=1508420 RepID=UPI000597C00E|nr:ABC transporter substrate-binding protein [Thermotoga profunda]